MQGGNTDVSVTGEAGSSRQGEIERRRCRLQRLLPRNLRTERSTPSLSTSPRAGQEAEELAKFSAENPHPVLRIAGNGLVLYANQASSDLLTFWDCAVGARVPAAVRDMISEVLRCGESRQMEVRCGAMCFLLAFAPVTEADFVHLYGMDITMRKQAEDDVHFNNALLEKVFETTHFCIVYLDRDFNFVRVNKAYAEACGHPVYFFSGKNHFDLYPHAENQAIFGRVVETGEPFTIYAKPFEYPDHPEWGVTYWDWSLHPVKDACGVVEGLVFVLVDVTERKRTEQALKESEQKYRDLFNNALVGLAVTRISDGKMVACNDKLAQILGYDTPEACVAEYVASEHYTDPHSRQQWVAELQEKGEVKDCVTHVTRCDGAPIWVRFSAYLPPEEGCIQSVVADITERKRTEEALQESQSRLQQIADTIDDVFWMTDWTTQQTIFATSAYERVLGRTLDSLYDGVEGWPDAIHPEDRQRAMDRFANLARGKKYSEEYRVLRPDGSVRWVLDRGIPLLDEAGEVYRVVGVAQDITERKRVEEEILQNQQQLRSLTMELSVVEERERKRLATILHDDIGQKLASSKMIVDLQLENELPDSVMKALTQVSRTLEQAAEQAHDLTFDLSTPILYEFGLAKAIGGWLAREVEEKHQVRVTFTDHGIPDAIDEDSAVFIFRSIRELAFNAIKHAQAQKLAVSIAWRDDQIEVEVMDDGRGFDYEVRRENRIKGGGFGLFSIRERLEYMGGRFLIDSEAGRGTRILLGVPVE